mmetsp:Transcript_34061/g.104603  ORF Transcript_34061/g.104603 Transcript_34061/m.104603 type:complete len:420 (-) Transcript_34061:1098-2357(-)
MGLRRSAGLMTLLFHPHSFRAEEHRIEWPFFMFSNNDFEGVKPTTSKTGNAYTTNRNVPLGCDCWKTGSIDSECDVFECTCICDLVAGGCDQNCCCDRECSEAQRSRFEACLPEGPLNQETTKCYSTNEVGQINPKFPVSAQSTASSSIDRMLCVQYDNSDFRGTFYKDSDLLDKSSLDKELVHNELGYFKWKANSAVVVDSDYDAGELLGSAFSLEHLHIEAFGGNLPLPISSQLGECSDFALAQFAKPTSTHCVRVYDISSLEQACETGVLSSSKFAADLLLASYGSISATGDDWIHVSTQSVRWEDFDTGEKYLVDEMSLNSTSQVCDTFYDDGRVHSTSPACMPDWMRPLAPSCRNALVSIRYNLRYNGNDANKIIAAEADLACHHGLRFGHLRCYSSRYSPMFQSWQTGAAILL